MLLGVIADDFTGASDIANTVSKGVPPQGGLRTVQYLGVPDTPAGLDVEAGVVALKSRSIDAHDAVSQALAAWKWLDRQGCRQIVFKYCSTFDSTPQGNIGPVAEALLDAMNAEGAVVCPAFPATGRAVFQGHLFVTDRLLNESGMENHPLNPMTDADIRRWLRRQTVGDVGFVGHGEVRKGAAAVQAAFNAQTAAKRRLVVVDAIDDGDLLTIGEAIANHRLITGGSGISLGLPRNFHRQGLTRNGGEADFVPLAGPGIVLSGSCSKASQAQLAHHLAHHPGLCIEPVDLMEDRVSVDGVAAWIAENLSRTPAVYSTAAPEGVARAQAAYGAAPVAERIEAFFTALAPRLVSMGVRNILVGGGETSGAVVLGLKVRQLLIGPEIDPGVPALAVIGGAPVRLALKSGNFGTVDFYEKALSILEGRP